jgi:hypothetical protein
MARNFREVREPSRLEAFRVNLKFHQGWPMDLEEEFGESENNRNGR